MKGIAIIAATLALFAVTLADEEKREKILQLQKCIACAEDHTAREEYMKCAELKPEKCKKIVEDCKAALMPEATTTDQCFDMICKNEDGIHEKVHECIMNDDRKKDLTEDEKTELKEFIKCAKKVGKKYCESD